MQKTLRNKWPVPEATTKLSHSDGRTNIYHLSYAPAIKKAYLFHWGCNLRCLGCLCQKEINCLALEENLDTVFRDPKLRSPQLPEQFLTFVQLTEILEKVDLVEVAFEGQEPSIDPWLPKICRWLKENFRNCRNILHTNGVHMADVTNIDEVIISLKAVTPEIYKEYTTMPNKYVLQNFKNYHNIGIEKKAESVFIPDYIGLEETEKIARFIASIDARIPYRIDAYFESGDNDWHHPTPVEMQKAVEVAKKYLEHVYSTQQTKHNLTKEDLLYEVIRLY